MFKIAKLKLKLSDNAINSVSYRQGSLFHGALMEIISPEYSDALHESKLHPFSQYIEKNDQGLFWNISCTNNDAITQIISKLMSLDGITISRLNLDLTFTDKQYTETSYENLTSMFYSENCSQYIDLRFNTPTSFKSEGSYMIFPQISNIYKSLMKKHDSAMAESSNPLFDYDTLGELCNNTRITKYNLRSCGYPLEGIIIPSFWGSLSLKISASQSLVNFAHMLFKFGEYSGVGIKTSLGMGAISIQYKNVGKKT